VRTVPEWKPKQQLCEDGRCLGREKMGMGMELDTEGGTAAEDEECGTDMEVGPPVKRVLRP
jgi:hypothetical protein